MDRSVAGDNDNIVELPVESAPAVVDENIVELPIEDEASLRQPIADLKSGAAIVAGDAAKIAKSIPSTYQALWNVAEQSQDRDSLAQKALETGHVTMDAALDAGMWGSKRLLDGLSYVNSKISHGLGTAAAYLYYPIGGKEALDLARARDKEMGYGDRWLPVSFGQDLIQDNMELYFKNKAPELLKSDSSLSRRTGEIMEGLGPAISAVSGIVGEGIVDPLTWTKLGALTKTGEALEKVGALEGGIARQVARGERALMETYGVVPLAGLQKKIGAPVLNAAAMAMNKTQASAMGRFVRHFTTNPGAGLADDGEELLMATNGLDVEKNINREMFTQKIENLGVDYKNAAERHALYSGADTPKGYRPDYNKVVPSYVAAEADAHMRPQLIQAVKESREAGLDIFEKEFLAAKKGGAEFSERYVPRYPNVSEAQQKKILDKFPELKEFDDMEKITGIMGEYGPSEGALKKLDSSFTMKRSELSREALNEEIESRTGISNYFHDDIALAYAQKIEDIKRATAQKRFMNKVLGKFSQAGGLTQDEWTVAKIKAKNNLKAVPIEAQGPLDMYMASVNTKRLRPLDGTLASKLEQSLQIPGLNKMVFPSPVKDFIEGIFMKRDYNWLEKMANKYTRAFKNSVLFSPGFHIRNAWENMGRGHVGGSSFGEGLKSMADSWFGTAKGQRAERLALFDSLSGDQNRVRDLVSGESLSRGGMVYKHPEFAEVDPEVLLGDHPLNRMIRGFQHQAATMGEQKFLDYTKKAWKMGVSAPGKAANLLIDNPLYRFSMSVNEKGEKPFRLAYFNTLMDKGYEPVEAMKKVNGLFMNYGLSRNAVRNPYVQAVVPFFNYSIKNAEIMGRMLAQEPSNFRLIGPGGRIERALADWAGYDPNTGYELRREFGPSYGDSLALGFMPNSKQLLQEKDWVKGWLHSYLATGQDDQADQMFFAHLPSNYHALTMLNPTEFNNYMSPVVKAGMSFFNIDPFTKKPIATEGRQEGVGDAGYAASEKLKRGMKELVSPLGGMYPNNVVNASRLVINDRFPAWRDNFLNLGFSPEIAKALFGNMMDSKERARAAKALVKIKSLWSGQMTSVDLDTLNRIGADAKITKDQINEMEKRTDWTKKGQQDIFFKRLSPILSRHWKRIDDSLGWVSEYQQRLSEATKGIGGPKDWRITSPRRRPEVEPKEPELMDMPQTPAEDSAALKDLMDNHDIIELPVGREPQSYYGSDPYKNIKGGHKIRGKKSDIEVRKQPRRTRQDMINQDREIEEEQRFINEQEGRVDYQPDWFKEGESGDDYSSEGGTIEGEHGGGK